MPPTSLRLYLFIQDEPFYLAAELPPLLKRFPIAGVALFGQRLPNDSLLKMLYRYLCLLGPVGFIRMCLTVLCGKITRKGSLLALFKKSEIPCRFVRNMNDPAFIEDVRQSGANLLVSIACPQIFKNPLISLGSNGAVNLHGGLLPDFPGAFTPFWNLYEGAIEAGCTLHYITDKIDGGDIIGQSRFPITPKDSMLDLYAQITKHGIALLIEQLSAIAEGRVQRRPNVYRQERYHTFPTWSEGREFRRKGLSFF